MTRSLVGLLSSSGGVSAECCGVVVTVNGLLFEAGIDHVNLYKLHKYVGLSTVQTDRA
jgi:hypothetical protein